MIFGYARVSTFEQNLDMQIADLEKYGCDEIFKEKVSTRKSERVQRDLLMSKLRKGDVLVIWKLDRYARSLVELKELVTKLDKMEVGFVSLNDPIDTTTAVGRFIYNMIASFAEFERDLISERTRAGLAAARAKGRVGGRPKGLSKENKAKAKIAATLYKDGTYTIKEILQQLKVSKSTFYNLLKHEGIEPGAQYSTKKSTRTK